MERIIIENKKAEKTQVVEFIGTPGVGKSTLYKKLREINDPLQKWTYLDVILRPTPPVFNFLSWTNYYLRKMFNKNPQTSIQVVKGINYIQQHERLAQFIWDHLSNPNFPANQDLGQRYRSAFYLFRDFCRYQTIYELDHKISCIIDEGLLQKSYLIHNDPNKINSLLDEYLSIVPLPQSIFYVYIDSIPIIVQRIKNRHKTLISHKGQNHNDLYTDIQRWQTLMELIVKKIKNFGVKVFPIDGEQPVSKNINQILDILKKDL